MYRYDIINLLAKKINAKRYLEIGVQDGNCFSQVQVEEKVGVDPNRSSRATIYLSSDVYFSKLPKEERFDLVFVDGLHHREQVHKDILNAWEHLSPGGVIVVHDCSPPTEAAGSRWQCSGVWCGDAWKGWMDARHILFAGALMFVVDTDLGCGIILPVAPGVPTIAPPWSKEKTDKAGWPFFEANRKAWLNLIHVDQFLSQIKEFECTPK